MWIVDFSRYGSPRVSTSRAILAYLVETMDRQNMTSQVDASLRARFPKQVISAGLAELRDLGIICRGREGRSWGIIWINPAVIRPWWVVGKLYTDRLDAFDQGPTGLGKKLHTQKNPQGEMPRGSAGAAGGHIQCPLREQETT